MRSCRLVSIAMSPISNETCWAFTGFYRVLPRFTEFRRRFGSFGADADGVSVTCASVSAVGGSGGGSFHLGTLPSFHAVVVVVVVVVVPVAFTEFHLGLLAFTGFYPVLPSFT